MAGKGHTFSLVTIKKTTSSCGGVIYFLAFLGALYYYWSTATSYWEGFTTFFQALLWPAFLVFELLTFVGA